MSSENHIDIGHKTERVREALRGATHVVVSNTGCLRHVPETLFDENARDIQDLDLNALKHVTSIGRSYAFLRFLPSLVRIDLTALSRVKTLPSRFLEKCSSLTDLDLTPLANVTRVEKRFLYRSGVTSIDLSQLPNVTCIDDMFLAKCASLTSVTFGEHDALVSIGNGCLSACPALTSVALPSQLMSLTKIGIGFLYLSVVPSIDLSVLFNMRRIENNCLACCDALVSVDLTPLHGVTRIDNYFLAGCTSLASVDLTPLENVTSIGKWFLTGCSQLKSVDLTPLRSLTSAETEASCNGILMQVLGVGVSAGQSDLLRNRERKTTVLSDYCCAL